VLIHEIVSVKYKKINAPFLERSEKYVKTGNENGNKCLFFENFMLYLGKANEGGAL
jgi:uncharacterized membrane protein YvbJ